MRKIIALTAVFLLFNGLAWADGAQDFLSGRKLRAEGRFPEALSYFTRALSDGQFILKEYVLFEIAETYQEKKENAYAAYKYDEFLKTFPQSALASRAKNRLGLSPKPKDRPVKVSSPAGKLYNLGRAYGRRGRYFIALGYMQSILRKYPSSAYADDARYYLSLYYELTDSPQAAITSYLGLLNEFPNSAYADDAIWRAGMLLYRRTDFDSALKVFSQAIKYRAGEETAKCLFWWGKLAERLGRPADAAGIYNYLAERFDHAYASYRARERLKALGYTLPLANPADNRREALTDDLNRRLLKYRTLMELDLVDYAQEEARVIIKLTGSITHESIEVRKLAYPKGYFEKVERYSRSFGVDPYLALAVIREESRFNPRALSRSRAHGLMQIIPSTGKILAKRLSITPYRRSKMYEVDTNIMMGTYYLADLIKRFDGNVALALAGYNGGPVRIKKLVNNWYNGDMRNLDIDEFIEFIPMRETRYYVQKVLGSYYEYKRLYE